MKTKNILISAGVLITCYLLWKNYKNKPKQKKCLKFNQVACIKAPCPASCEEYEK